MAPAHTGVRDTGSQCVKINGRYAAGKVHSAQEFGKSGIVANGIEFPPNRGSGLCSAPLEMCSFLISRSMSVIAC